MKKSLISAFIAVIFIGTTVIVLFSNWVVRDIYRNEVKRNLILLAQVLEAEIINEIDGTMSSEREEVLIFYNNVARKYADVFSTANAESQDKSKVRVTIISLEGIVLGESDADTEKMENHLNRPEIQLALQNGMGSNIRLSDTLKVHFMYTAKLVASKEIIIRLAIPLNELKNIYLKILIYSLVALIIAIILTLRFSFKIAAHLLYPIEQITEVTNRIAKGEYRRRVDVKARHEVGDLVKNFNLMADALEENIVSLKGQNNKFDTVINSMSNGLIAVNRGYNVILVNPAGKELLGLNNSETLIGKNILEIVRHRVLNQALKETIETGNSLMDEINIVSGGESRVLRVNTTPIRPLDDEYLNSGGIIYLTDITKIKKLEEIRTSFVSNVTHELKTPLTSIRGFVETLKNGAIEDKEVAYRFLDIIDIEAERLFLLINDILQLSEIETMKNDTNLTSVSLFEVIHDVNEILAGVSFAKQVELQLSIPKELSIMANTNRMKQLFLNLIDNAIKYNRNNGYVRITGTQISGGIAEIRIEDSGIGISKEHQQRIFERFYRVDKGRSRNMGGTGLGLSIVKHIINLYNGSIDIESTEGEGTKFVVRLPIGNLDR